jgi:pilus assembly protein Flp/PilA
MPVVSSSVPGKTPDPEGPKQTDVKEYTHMSLFNRFIKDESGATAIEYGLIAALVSVAIIVVLGSVGTNLKAVFQKVADSLAIT